ncbi:MAG: GTPase of the mitochondrial inner membrane that associates with the large ribosomal subunit [Icmadophila ericetorum]|nr:GTPase of the mitochondrial inner membrane that associates with the large ribosomal subunit [Icmadophila ericetorum]
MKPPQLNIPLSISHLNPPPEDYGRTIFTDKCILHLHAGAGGHGCISFLREKYIADGPPNGGDGGTGGNVYIQAVSGETSLHKLARRRIMKAGRGKNGQGKNKGGQRGEDILIKVPVGTVVREVSRYDPVAEEEEKAKIHAGKIHKESTGETKGTWRRDKWMLHPSSLPSDYAMAEFPPLPKTRRSSIASLQPPAPISLDLSKPTEQPILLAAGAVGGLGNPHFITREVTKPKVATKGDQAMNVTVELELKLLADVGFVGLPNAGKSTLLRALSRSRARIGDWAFTTLQPNIGTVVLDNNQGRPKIQAQQADGQPRTTFSVADIPGIIPDAHLDRGLGLDFLRHVERAQVVAFVIDLSAPDVVGVLKSLWNELKEFESMKEMELNSRTEQRMVQWKPYISAAPASPRQDVALSGGQRHTVISPTGSQTLPELEMPPISTKPWFVVATKADLEASQDSFVKLQTYLQGVAKGEVEHPSGRKAPWKGKLAAIPVSAIRGEGVERIAEWTIQLLGQ